jgi:hypothetical protein
MPPGRGNHSNHRGGQEGGRPRFDPGCTSIEFGRVIKQWCDDGTLVRAAPEWHSRGKHNIRLWCQQIAKLKGWSINTDKAYKFIKEADAHAVSLDREHRTPLTAVAPNASYLDHSGKSFAN